MYCMICGKKIDKKQGFICCECKYEGYNENCDKNNFDYTYGNKGFILNNIDNILEDKRKQNYKK